MDFLIHITQQLSEYYANRSLPVTNDKGASPKATLALNLVLYFIFINIPIALPATFIVILTNDRKILPTYSIVGISLLVLLVLVEGISLKRVWKAFFEQEFLDANKAHIEDDVQYKLSSALLFLVLSIIPFLHILFCPLAVIYATEGFVTVIKNGLHRKYEITAKRFILFALLIFTVYSTVTLFVILIQGNELAMK